MKKKLIKIASTLLVLLLLMVVVGEFSGVLAQSATASATPTATAETLPDAGVSMPTIFGMLIGVLAILGSLALAF